ncbi:hypothetical protein ACU8KH_00976 [Lachancea thermotolerans]
MFEFRVGLSTSIIVDRNNQLKIFSLKVPKKKGLSEQKHRRHSVKRKYIKKSFLIKETLDKLLHMGSRTKIRSLLKDIQKEDSMHCTLQFNDIRLFFILH